MESDKAGNNVQAIDLYNRINALSQLFGEIPNLNQKVISDFFDCFIKPFEIGMNFNGNLIDYNWQETCGSDVLNILEKLIDLDVFKLDAKIIEFEIKNSYKLLEDSDFGNKLIMGDGNNFI